MELFIFLMLLIKLSLHLLSLCGAQGSRIGNCEQFAHINHFADMLFYAVQHNFL